MLIYFEKRRICVLGVDRLFKWRYKVGVKNMGLDFRKNIRVGNMDLGD